MSIWDTTRNASGHLAFSNANKTLTYTGTAGTDSPSFSTNFHATGKYVVRYSIIQVVTGHTGIGFGDSTASSAGGTGYVGNDTHSFALNNNGSWALNGSFPASGLGTPAFVAGDNADLAIDLGGKLAWARVNGGSWFGNGVAGDPTAGTNGFDISGLAGFTLSPAGNVFGGSPNDSMDIGTQVTSISGYAAWDCVPGSLAMMGVGCWAVAKKLEENPIIARRRLIVPHQRLFDR